ncbi:MAG: helix-turn-helix domain-containing protein [Zoogloeaceae bacterium]|jgi:transcriptional regulator with XRE-family HTH domain|nr:helix-turn-helix domain-containing protein [Zoogloeaceae bacterium]
MNTIDRKKHSAEFKARAQKEFGLRLAELRRKHGWSQETLANESGVARSYLGSVERGHRNISLENICKLADALEVLPPDLLIPPVGDLVKTKRSYMKRSDKPAPKA